MEFPLGETQRQTFDQVGVADGQQIQSNFALNHQSVHLTHEEMMHLLEQDNHKELLFIAACHNPILIWGRIKH